MNKMIIAFAAVIFLAAGALAQKPLKPWAEWSKKDAQKILDESPWSQTQTETDTSEMLYSPSNLGDTRSRETQGATNQGTSVKFRIRLYSARPIRQAFVRLIELNQSEPDQTEAGESATQKRRAWADLSAGDFIIVTVACEGTDRRYLGRVMQAFNSAVTSVLKNSAYLERKDGKRVFLSDYVPPGKDPFGARFIFSRTIDGQPFITADSGTMRFHAEYENNIPLDSISTARTGSTSRQTNSTIQTDSAFKLKLDMKFKVAEMSYKGELEF
ncbi:MAG: hypothetical protein M3Q91_18205 [Acidobacteriota bacterium]|nr:hypothetical protein [Acidobacteriota bacterium]